MRVNVYAEEMTERVEIVQKGEFTGLRFYLELPVTIPEGHYERGLHADRDCNFQGPFIHHPGDDDSAAVTFWGKRQMLALLQKALTMLAAHYGERDPQSVMIAAGADAAKWANEALRLLLEISRRGMLPDDLHVRATDLLAAHPGD